MSTTARPIGQPRPTGQFIRPSMAGLFVAMALLLAGGNLAGNGAFAPPDTAGGLLQEWERGNLLQLLAEWVAGWFAPVIAQQTALALIYIGLAASGGAAIFAQLRRSDWPVAQAALALVLILSHAMLLRAVTTAGPEFLIVIAAGLLIPGRRALEAVGDAQSVINFGLTLPLLLLSGPPLAALVPVLLLAVPLSDQQARREPDAFMAMLLVGIVPVLVIVTGIVALAARAGLGPDGLLVPFLHAFRWQSGPTGGSLMLMVISAPLALAAVVHAIVPDRRRKISTSMLVWAVPIYLAVGNTVFAFNLAIWAPAVALLATGLGWLCATRVRPWMRWLALGLLLAGSAASWRLAPIWAEPAWLEGLLPFQIFGLRFG